MKNVTGWFVYQNIVAQQHEDVGGVFKELFENTKPKQILEIGTASGGLTLMLRDILNDLTLNDTTLRTYDVIEKHYLNSHVESGANIEIIIKDVFNHSYTELVEVEEISSYIQRDGTTIVLCDGGSKKNEFRILSKLLKEGDIIMAHDYSPNENYFNEHINNKVWNWLEIQDSDINNSCIENNLQPYMSEEFKQVVWVCKKKV
jgi:hypothetical protein